MYLSILKAEYFQKYLFFAYLGYKMRRTRPISLRTGYWGSRLIAGLDTLYCNKV
jgi:hypothetical protein